MTPNKSNDDRPKWHDDAGLSENTDSIRVYPSKQQKEKWRAEADRLNISMSRFVVTRVERQMYQEENNAESGPNGPSAEAEKLDELQEEVEQLREENQRLKRRQSAQSSIPDSTQVKQFLSTSEIKDLSQLLQEIIEHGALDQILRKPVENELYYLAQKGEVEFVRTPDEGWRVIDE